MQTAELKMASGSRSWRKINEQGLSEKLIIYSKFDMIYTLEGYLVYHLTSNHT